MSNQSDTGLSRRHVLCGGASTGVGLVSLVDVSSGALDASDEGATIDVALNRHTPNVEISTDETVTFVHAGGLYDLTVVVEDSSPIWSATLQGFGDDTATFDPPGEGTYEYIVDSSTSGTIKVGDDQLTVDIEHEPINPHPMDDVTFEATANKENVKYEWQFGANAPFESGTSSKTRQFDQITDLTVTVRVSDNDEQEATATTDVTIEGFDPTIHGFGFDNWSASDTWEVDGDVLEHDHDEVSQNEVEQAVDDVWTPRLGGSLKEVFTEWLYRGMRQQFLSNGHCYGMVHAAYEYYNDPSSLPTDVDQANELPYPVGDYSAVGDLIDYYQGSQAFDSASSSSVFNVLRSSVRSEEIDHEDEFEAAIAAIDEHGAVGIALSDTDVNSHHAVLAYNYDDDALFVYDPNQPAETYINDRRAYRVELNADESVYIKDNSPSRYDSFVAETDMTREVGTIPLYTAATLSAIAIPTGQAVSVGASFADVAADVADSVVGVFAGLNSPAQLSVDRDVEHSTALGTAEFADPEAGEYADVTAVIAARDAEPEISVVGDGDGTYALDIISATEEHLVETTKDGDISSDTTIDYTINTEAETIEIEESGSTHLEGAEGEEDSDSIPGVGVGGALAGLSGAAYLLQRRLKTQDTEGSTSENVD